MSATDEPDPIARVRAAGSDCGPGCEQALEDLERFLDGELPATEVERISEHLAACYPCTDRATFEEQLRAVVRRGCADSAPPELVARIRTALDVGGIPGQGGGADG